MYIISLAVADLIVGLTVMPISTIYIFTGDWIFGIAICQIWIGIDYIASTASILNLFILSLDRYWSVKSPLKYLRKRTKKRALYMISVVWFSSTLWIIPVTGWHVFARNGVRVVPDNVCDTEYATNSLFKIVTAFFNFYLPLSIMYTLYWKVFKEIRKRSLLELGQRRSKGYLTGYHKKHNDDYLNDHTEQANGISTFEEDVTPPQSHVVNEYSSSISDHKSNSNDNTEIAESHEVVINQAHTCSYRKESFTDNYLTVRSLSCSQCKSEYAYDESVVDPKTERLQRYYYRDRQQPCNHNEANHVSSSSALCKKKTSNRKDKDLRSSRSKSRKSKHKYSACKSEKYSIISGLRKIKEAEILLDRTVCLADSGLVTGRSPLEQIALRDDKNRRLTAVLNIKDRLKNLRPSSALSKEIKAARQLGVIMGAFTICFLPYFILFLVVALCEGCIDDNYMIAATWIGYLNSTLNPLLYPLCNANFRRKFRRMLGLRERRDFSRVKSPNDRFSVTTGKYD